MRKQVVVSLLFLFTQPTWAQTVPAGWKVVKDSKIACQIAVPPEWTPWADNSGEAVFRDSTTAIAVVTRQPGQAFKPLTEPLKKSFGISTEKMFENTAKRVFYQDRTSSHSEEPNAYSGSVPGNGGACSCRVVFLPSISQETAKKIVLSLGPAVEPKPGHEDHA
jgi:hypothetical protein